MKKYISTVLLLAAAVSCTENPDMLIPQLDLVTDYPDASFAGQILHITSDAAGAEAEISVESTWEWDYSVESGNWYAVEADGKSLRIIVPENVSGEMREGMLKIRSSNSAGIAEAYIKVSQTAGNMPELVVSPQGGDSGILFSGNGGSCRVDVASNVEWNVFCAEGWVVVSRDDTGFDVTVSDNSTARTRTAEIKVAAGDSPYDKEVLIPVSQPGLVKAMHLELTVDESSGRRGSLPFDGEINCIIDWGDGNIQKVTSSWPMHFYLENGVYDVYVVGKVSVFNSGDEMFDEDYRRTFTAVRSWGELGIESLSGGFSGCTALRSVAAPEEGTFSMLTTAEDAFSGCSSLVQIEGDLFSNAPELEYAGGLFHGCSSLESIPEGLFSGCPWLSDLSSAFSGCSSLEAIPSSLFDNCLKITDLTDAFSGCASLSGESPYHVSGGAKVHLYERNGSGGFFPVTNHSGCFSGCTGLSDYGTISSGYPDWI